MHRFRLTFKTLSSQHWRGLTGLAQAHKKEGPPCAGEVGEQSRAEGCPRQGFPARGHNMAGFEGQ
ncbi:hypothetical protein CEQ28_008185 [Hafnia alvei]|nr:hypothetical protein CEQ28_008185 [Hafnia alvei]